MTKEGNHECQRLRETIRTSTDAALIQYNLLLEQVSRGDARLSVDPAL